MSELKCTSCKHRSFKQGNGNPSRYHCKTPLEVRNEALRAEMAQYYPIPRNKRIEKYKENGVHRKTTTYLCGRSSVLVLDI